MTSWRRTAALLLCARLDRFTSVASGYRHQHTSLVPRRPASASWGDKQSNLPLSSRSALACSLYDTQVWALRIINA